MALAKNSDDSESVLFLSTDYGRSFRDISGKLANQGKRAQIHKYYNVKGFINHYVFSDIKNKCVYTTDNSGESFIPHCDVPFTPTTLLLNNLHPRHILGMDENDPYKQLYQSEDFGYTWRPIFNNVKAFFWGVQPFDHPLTVYVMEERSNGKSQIVKNRNQSSEVLLQDAIDFEVKGEYMFATLSKWLIGAPSNPNNQFWVSYKRQSFVKADFPITGNVSDYFVADASEGQLMVCVYHNNSANLYVSDVQGYRFSLSLERIVYFNPKIMQNNFWLRLYSNETFADLTKVSGVEGIYIASQQTSSLLDLEHQITLISYDKGGQWQRIQAPYQTLGRPCDLSLNCSLHLTQELSRLIPGSLATPILTQDSSPGLVIASGTIGSSLKGEPDVFLSVNAGISWRQVLSGNYMYASADHGGIIVAIHQFIPTNELMYSLDEGITWTRYKFVNESIRVYGLLTEPGENTTIFSVFGSGLIRHSWVILQIDFLNLFNGVKCGPSDYYMWSANDNLPSEDGCLLGRITQYQRRYASVKCYNGEDFVRTAQVRNCTCTSEDFECDFGYEEDTLVLQNSSKSELICRRTPSLDSSKLNPVPSSCLPGTFYYFSRGYRKVAGDTCQGQDHHYAPLKYSCPVRESSAFLLVSTYRSVLMIDLASQTKTTIPLEDAATSPPAIFDYEKNCIIYVTLDKYLKTNCLGYNRNSTEVSLITSQMNFTAMAFEWTGRNVYFTDSLEDAIRVVNVDGRFELTLYNASNGVYRPNQIVLDPPHGYLYFVGSVDAGNQTYAIYQAVMDGSDKTVTQLVNTSVHYTTYLTLDAETERLYWIASTNNRLYYYSLSRRELSSYTGAVINRDISGIGIFKDLVYLVGSFSSFVYTMDKHRSDQGYSIMGIISSRAYGIVVVSNTSQHAMSACSPYNKPCTQLCMPMPSTGPHSQNRTCLCGEGYRKDSHAQSNDQMCLCEPGEVLQTNGTCVKSANVTTCASDKLTCKNGHCVLKAWHCDGDDDCGDGTDEKDCPFATCADGTFTCSSGKCIPEHWRCDREDDCRDGIASDEIKCNRSCAEHQFRCNNGYCIDRSWVCDKDNDCHDGSDETANCKHNATCGPFSFTCKSGDCVDSYYHCNGEKDCLDGSDEDDCAKNKTTCSSDYQFTCANNNCIFISWRCDGDKDCSDGSDEVNCSFTVPPTTVRPSPHCGFLYHRCTNRACVSFLDICNGIDDCGDGSDEDGCDDELLTTMSWTTEASTCSSLQYQCESSGLFGKCIEKNWVCDGEPDCERGDDERNCHTSRKCADSEFKCHSDGGCIASYKRCDQHIDCSDESDESGCDYNITVTCSNFNGNKLTCCSNPACGVYISESGMCKPVKEAQFNTKSNKCDGIINVNYTCKDGQFKCNNGQLSCVSWVQVCDTKRDCDGSFLDEANCEDCHTLGSLTFDKVVKNDSVEFYSLSLSSVSYALKNGSMPWGSLAWTNVSRSRSEFKVDHLKPASTYYFVLFQEVPGSKKQCPYSNLQLTTSDGLPSSPEHVETSVRLENYGQVLAVNVTWSKPKLTNGQILEYIVFYQEVDASGKIQSDVYSVPHIQATRVIVYEHIDKDKHFNFWVVAKTSAGFGEPSEVKRIILNPKEATDLKIAVISLNSTSVQVTWVKEPVAEGYRVNLHYHDDVSIEFPASAIKEFSKDVDKKSTSVIIDDLCPQTEYLFSVMARLSNNSFGPQWYSKKIQLNGTMPRLGPLNVTRTGPTSVIVSFNVIQGVSKVNYIYYTHDKTLAAVERVTYQDSIELNGLLACENYFVWVRPTSHYCLTSDLEKFITSLDLEAAPKHLMSSVVRNTNNTYSIILKWKASCYNMERNMSYIIHVMTTDGAHDVVTAEYQEIDINYPLPNALPGMTYYFTVRSNISGSRESEKVSAYIPGDGPYNVVVSQLEGHQVHLTWAWPQANSLTEFKEFVVHTKGDNVEFENHTSKFEIDLTLPREGTYFFKVEVKGKSDKTLAESSSEEFSVVYHDSSKTDAVSISKTNLVAIIVPVAVVVVALSVGLVVFIVRHKRLQSSFLAFANSHYNIQSGTTTFSDDLDNDEPMIQGFSDDEPLVIA
ncbi:Sortilin- receptor [Biomphalaria glabrata]